MSLADGSGTRWIPDARGRAVQRLPLGDPGLSCPVGIAVAMMGGMVLVGRDELVAYHAELPICTIASSRRTAPNRFSTAHAFFAAEPGPP